MRGLSFEAYKDEEQIGIEDGMLKLRKTSGSYKDYSHSFYKVWSEAFINYTSILVSLFGATVPHFQATLTQFYGLMLQLSKVYDWKEALFPMAIEVHSHIVTQQPIGPKQWVILLEFQGRICTPMTVIGMNSLLGSTKQKRSNSPPARRGRKQTGSTTNNPLVVCDLFNKGSCAWVGCERAHKCKGCGNKEYGLGNCTKRKWRFGAGGLEEGMISETVHVASIANDDDLSLRKFMKAFPCLPAPPRPNTSTRFRLVVASQPPLKSFPSPLKAAA